MDKRARWARILVIIGLVVMAIGIIDPLEGSLIILPGIALVMVGTFLAKGRRRKLLLWAFCLAAAGIAALWILSSMGGFEGTTGVSSWWALTLLPYPIGWLLALIGAVRTLGEFNKRSTADK